MKTLFSISFTAALFFYLTILAGSFLVGGVEAGGPRCKEPFAKYELLVPTFRVGCWIFGSLADSLSDPLFAPEPKPEPTVFIQDEIWRYL